MCIYIDRPNESPSKLHVGCCCGNTVVNRVVHANDIVSLSPSANGLQRIVSYSHGCENDIILSSKSQVMFLIPTLKCSHK